jgi:hypothetical protein
LVHLPNANELLLWHKVNKTNNGKRTGEIGVPPDERPRAGRCPPRGCPEVQSKVVPKRQVTKKKKKRERERGENHRMFTCLSKKFIGDDGSGK